MIEGGGQRMSEVRLIDANALKEKFSNMYRDDYEKWIKAIIDNAPTIEPRIEYGSDGEPYRLFISGGHVVPDTLPGWRYEERSTGGHVIPDVLQGWKYQEAEDEKDNI